MRERESGLTVKYLDSYTYRVNDSQTFKKEIKYGGMLIESHLKEFKCFCYPHSKKGTFDCCQNI